MTVEARAPLAPQGKGLVSALALPATCPPSGCSAALGALSQPALPGHRGHDAPLPRASTSRLVKNVVVTPARLHLRGVRRAGVVDE